MIVIFGFSREVSWSWRPGLYFRSFCLVVLRDLTNVLTLFKVHLHPGSGCGSQMSNSQSLDVSKPHFMEELF